MCSNDHHLIWDVPYVPHADFVCSHLDTGQDRRQLGPCAASTLVKRLCACMRVRMCIRVRMCMRVRVCGVCY